MNKFVLLLSLLLLIGCKKQETVSPFWGTAQALMNGEPWIGQGWTLKITGAQPQWNNVYNEPPCSKDVITIEIQKLNAAGYKREVITIHKVPPQIGRYEVKLLQDCKVSTAVGADYHLLGDDGDLLLDSYKVLETSHNILEVTSYNESSGEIKGTFSISFVFDEQNESSKNVTSHPDTVHFTSGVFHTRVLERK